MKGRHHQNAEYKAQGGANPKSLAFFQLVEI